MSTQMLPLLIQGAGVELAEFILRGRETLRESLRGSGALLFRGFSVPGIDSFQGAVKALSGDPLEYSERSSPRSAIRGRVYTSTDYPPAAEIFLHNENSYQAAWPGMLYFYCLEPPASNGATPLADTRRILASIDRAVREEFERRQWMVVRNYHADLGIPWTDAFNTKSRREVEQYCERNGIEAEWRPGDGLRTRAVRRAVHHHPQLGIPVWFNHATVFHVSTLQAEVAEGLLEMFGEEGLPSNTYYGDGGRIPDDVMDHLRLCYRAASSRFDYCRGDVLVIDNMLTAHGREPFTGPRRIAVAMAELISG